MRADSGASFIDALIQAGGRVFQVGGSVRDRLMGHASKDSDLIVTKIPFDDLCQRLRPLGDVFLVGKSFGVIKFHPHDEDGVEYDIALPRRESSTGVGHRDFHVDFDPQLPVEIDLSRRDFTINAMARDCQTGNLLDPFGGREDLSGRILRMVFDRAFDEDPLRLLRGIQFAARFQLTIEPRTLEAMTKAAELIKTVSPERIAGEIQKLFLAEKPSIGFLWMQKTQLLQHVFPELAENVGVEQGNKLQNDDVFLHTLRVLDASRKDPAIPQAGEINLMFAALFHDVGKAKTKRFDKLKNRMTFYGHHSLSRRMAMKRLNALKMSTVGVDPQEVGHLVEHHMFQTKSFFSDRAIRRFVNKIGPDRILKLVDLRLADNRGGKYPEGIKGVLRLRKKIAEELEKKTPFGVKDLAIGGLELMSLGVPESPMIGRILKALLEIVLDDPEKNTPEILTQAAKEMLVHGITEKEEPEDDTKDTIEGTTKEEL